MSRIALVEDHARLAELVVKALATVSIMADVFPRIASARQSLIDGMYVATVIDRGLPDGDGLTLVRAMRAASVSTPCLILTARDALHDRVDGLDAGADDYLAKPFAMQELVARVQALIRRPAQMTSETPTFADLQLLPQTGQMSCAEQRITLAPAEMQILMCLMSSEGATVRRLTLELAAWGISEAVTPNALDVALHRLRRKIMAIGSTVQIANTRGHGYALLQT